MFNGLFGKKKQNTPQPAAPTDDFADAPNLKRICQLLDYTPMLPIKEAGYFFVSNHFCCAVFNEGIIYAAPCIGTMTPYFHGVVIRPFQIAQIVSEESGLNDNGVVLQCVSVFIHDPDDCEQICIPPDDWFKFNAAVKDCVESDAMDGKHEYGGFQQLM